MKGFFLSLCYNLCITFAEINGQHPQYQQYISVLLNVAVSATSASMYDNTNNTGITIVWMNKKLRPEMIIQFIS